MSIQDNSGPAFPTANSGYDGDWDKRQQIEGMTLRQYAAIKLCVPDSGTDWLDEMIRASQSQTDACPCDSEMIKNYSRMTLGVQVLLWIVVICFAAMVFYRHHELLRSFF